jgi:hypothetical protein
MPRKGTGGRRVRSADAGSGKGGLVSGERGLELLVALLDWPKWAGTTDERACRWDGRRVYGIVFDADAIGAGKGGDGDQGLAINEADLAQLPVALGSTLGIFVVLV